MNLTVWLMIVKFLYLIHRVCEGTVHSEEISKQYLESVKTVKQVDALHQRKNSKSKHKGRGHGGHRSHSRSQSRKPSRCSKCAFSDPPKKYKVYGKECFYCHKKGHFSQFCHSKQHGKLPGSNVRSSSQNNRFSCRDIHEIESQFDDSIQFEQDSITIQFMTASQTRHTNVMFNEMSSTPSLQRVLTDVHVKPIEINQSHWSKHHFKIDSRAYENLMPLSMFKSLYNDKLPSSTKINHAVHLVDYNRQEVKQLGTCVVSIKFRSTAKHVHFYIVPDRLKPILGVDDALALGLTSFHCPIYTDWQSDLTTSVDSVPSNANSTVCTGTGTGIVKFHNPRIYYGYIDETGYY